LDKRELTWTGSLKFNGLNGQGQTGMDWKVSRQRRKTRRTAAGG
jgi:hypothetical protein